MTRDGDKLFAQATGQQAFLLLPESATTFSAKIVNAQIEFEIDAAGTVTGLVLVQNGEGSRDQKEVNRLKLAQRWLTVIAERASDE